MLRRMLHCGKARTGIARRTSLQQPAAAKATIPPETLAPVTLLGFNLNKIAYIVVAALNSTWVKLHL
ncbi:MAG: hypothetical protein KGJ99_03310 [Betaproteobacteria bacterium]|nr:hypothetical protein [Betaproteobacteria bacterium]MDE2002989.1 hypothetical protein [Betaproteobacteria bacterium]MDE2208735.1 hypothetical protein [Betaproteobacteria bacterium]